MRYQLDSKQGRFTVQAFARGMLAAMGHSPTFAIRSFTGELRFTPEAPQDTAFQLTVQPESLSVRDAISPNDRSEIERQMRQDVLQTTLYPEITYQSSEAVIDRIVEGWYRLRLTGILHLHGVTHPHQVDAQLRVLEAEARISGQSTLLQSLYRIKEVSALGGMIKLKDELKFDFDLVGLKQEN